MTTTLEAASRSHVGYVRSQNEDSYHADSDTGLFIVADGMGGHAAGEVASRIAVETLAEAVAPGSEDESGGDRDRPARLAPAIEDANRRIHAEGTDSPDRSGMGTTVTALLLDGERWHLGHVGDSRAYLLREGNLQRLSTDHSWVEEQVEQGKLSREEARLHPASSMLTRALGTDRHVEVDRREGEIREGDLYLLASDGLTDMMPEERVAELCGADDPVDGTVRRLIREALEAGGRDNVTAVVVRVLSAEA